MPTSFWKISTNTKTEEKCKKILNKVKALLNQPAIEVTYEPHWDTKEFSGSFQLRSNSSSKEELMFELILLGQQIGYDWQLNGSIDRQTSAHSTRFMVSGIVFAEWHVDIPDEWLDLLRESKHKPLED